MFFFFSVLKPCTEEKKTSNLTHRFLYLISRQVFSAVQFTIFHLKGHKKYFQEKRHRLPSWKITILIRRISQKRKNKKPVFVDIWVSTSRNPNRKSQKIWKLTTTLDRKYGFQSPLQPPYMQIRVRKETRYKTRLLSKLQLFSWTLRKLTQDTWFNK